MRKKCRNIKGFDDNMAKLIEKCKKKNKFFSEKKHLRFFKFYIKIVSGGAKWHKVERCGTGFGDTEIRDKLSPFNHGTKDKEAAQRCLSESMIRISRRKRQSQHTCKVQSGSRRELCCHRGRGKVRPFLYPVEEWNKFMERIASDFEPQVRAMMMRYVQRNSAECSLDSQGRVVIPPQGQRVCGSVKRDCCCRRTNKG